MIGKDRIMAKVTAGSTNIAACTRIMLMKPSFVKPTRRITPNSKDFVSTDMSSSEKTSRIDTTTNMISSTLKIRPMNSTA